MLLTNELTRQAYDRLDKTSGFVDEIEIVKFYREQLSKVIAEIELSVKKLKSYEEQKTEEQGKE